MAKAAKAFGITTDAAELSAIEADLARELASIKAYEDGLYAVQKLLDAGIKVGICSNLGMPYVEPVNDCERLPDGSSALPFTQKYQNWHMRCRLIRPGMYGMKTAYECWIDFKVAQVKKIQAGIAIRCSPALGNEIRRIALTGDIGF